MSASQVRYTKSQRGAVKVIHEGFMYTRHRELARGGKWRCDLRGECSGYLILNDDDNIIEKGDHTHTADWGRCKVRECVVSLKKKAERSRANTSATVLSAVAGVSDETAMKLPKNASLRKIVRRVRRQHRPIKPKTLKDLEEIPDKFRNNLKGKSTCKKVQRAANLCL